MNRSYRPVFFHEFVANEYFRQRYWARSFLGGFGLLAGSIRLNMSELASRPCASG